MTAETPRADLPDGIPADVEVPDHRIDREIYAMPAFTTLPVADLSLAVAWYGSLGFEVLAEMGEGPMRVVHLRRYRYQDLLLVPASPATTPPASEPASGGARINFSHTGPLDDLDTMVAAAREQSTGTVTGPTPTPWHAVEVEAIDADGHVVVMTARSATPPPQAFLDDVRGSLTE